MTVSYESKLFYYDTKELAQRMQVSQEEIIKPIADKKIDRHNLNGVSFYLATNQTSIDRKISQTKTLTNQIIFCVSARYFKNYFAEDNLI
jgi:predicted DNA-binding ribbon-helix-helix protein